MSMKWLRAPLLAALVLGALTTSALADPDHPTGPPEANPTGSLLGVVPTHGNAGALARNAAGGNLVYHNGPTMHTNQVYAIFWCPSNINGENCGSGDYTSAIAGYFGNVAAGSGKTSNVYDSDTQYYDKTNGNILYGSSFAGSYLDTSPITSGCSLYSVNSVKMSACVTDSQLQAEIKSDLAKNGWTATSTRAFFIFTAKGIGSCYGSECAFSSFCAYHSWDGSGSNALLYANMPYAMTVTYNCDSQQHPNGDDADATLNVTSHEHNESITDPQGSAWYDVRGNEDGDKCAWNFGTSTGSTRSGQYNQTINGHSYYLQQEWSNQSKGCVLSGT
jgi:hypothetical protein